jgi:hypothetical protein
MSTRGNAENARLRANIEDQMNRLLTQLQDLEDMKSDLEEGEYEESRKDTLMQMEEFEQTLNKMISGDMTLVDEIGMIQLAIQSAIRSAFKSPEVIKMFAKRENGALRSRLASLDQDLKLGRISAENYDAQAAEIITALNKLGEPLEIREMELLEKVLI